MGLRIQREADLEKPVVACDHCGGIIDDADAGNYEWEVDDQGRLTDGRIYFTHKRCCREFEVANGGRPQWHACGLECLPIFLANNLGIEWEEGKRSARFMADLGDE